MEAAPTPRGQRTRELALLRTLGASPSQIRRSVMGESVVIGTLASALGIGGGVLTAKGIDALVAALGVGLPDYPFVLSGRTIVAALVIGFGVTVVAATGPARKASTIPAIAALSAVDQSTSVGSRTRKVSGTVMITFGAVIGALGLSGAGSTAVTVAAMALGAMGVFLGVATLSPLMVEAVTTIIGWPLRRVSGVAGTMAQRNAARNPRRTATTAAALMIGLALVSTAIVVGDSIKQHIGGTIEEVARADYFITDDLDEVDLPAELTSELAQTGMVDQVAGFAYTEAELNGEVVDITVTDFETIDALLDLDFSPGALANPTAFPVVVRAEQARRLAIVEGDIITTRLADGTTVEATVTGTFGESGGVVTDYLYDVASAEAIGLSPSYEWVAFNLADGVSASMADTLADAVAEQLPDVHVETADAYVERVQGSIDTLLAIVNVMVALAVVIALIGIANTLALSVFERTRELGLVRAVGMTRRQLRRMVRLEAAMVATFGAVLGIAVGLLFGWAVVTALPQTIAGSVSVPLQPLLSLMLVAAFSGVLAAVLPARRAGHLDVLDAIAH